MNKEKNMPRREMGFWEFVYSIPAEQYRRMEELAEQYRAWIRLVSV